jgi:hypothetical protein
MTLVKIHLELGRTAEFPNGNPSLGYEFILPLAEDGHIDMAAWSRCKDLCTVRRFNEGFTDRRGMVRHTSNGWQFDYDKSSDADNELFARLESHILAPGQYVSLSSGEGPVRPFKIVSVAPVETSQDAGR